MERLTHKRENGIKTGYWSPSKKQDLIDRLAEYEDTGLTPEQIRQIDVLYAEKRRELRERDTPKAAIITGYNFAIGCKVGECPVCGAMTRDIERFCRDCGQRLGWEDEM